MSTRSKNSGNTGDREDVLVTGSEKPARSMQVKCQKDRTVGQLWSGEL